MGAACCCLRDDWEDLTIHNSSIYRNCVCLNCFIGSFLHAYARLFSREEEHALPSSSHGEAALSSTSSLDDSLPNTYRSPPRPLPYDAEPRYARLRHDEDELASCRDKGSSHLHKETENGVNQESESVSNKNKLNGFNCEEASKEYNIKSSLKFSTAKPETGFAHIYTSSEDEDVCPTCLEEYTEENPKIVTKCTHHFHLGCIYEWMERSDNCPVCGKLMDFDETI